MADAIVIAELRKWIEALNPQQRAPAKRRTSRIVSKSQQPTARAPESR
ncbi:MAG: hypothetical protein ACOZAM_16290 [Pseudomonadota bacterium]